MLLLLLSFIIIILVVIIVIIIIIIIVIKWQVSRMNASQFTTCANELSATEARSCYVAGQCLVCS